MKKNPFKLESIAEKIVPFTKFDVHDRIEETVKSLEKNQKLNIITARAYFLLIYTYLFPEEAATTITHSDIAEDVIIDSNKFPQFADSLTSQIMCCFLKVVKSSPRKLAYALSKAIDEIPIHYFCFATFPALFGYFTSADFCESAIEFVLTVFEMSRNEKLIENLLLCFLFSSFSFTECLWHNFSQTITSNPSNAEITNALKSSITKALPKLPQHVYVALTAISNEYKNVFSNVTKIFLEKTFIVWQQQSGECISLNDSIMKFMKSDASKDMFLDIFTRIFLPIVEAPSYWKNCALTQENMLFSAVDLQVICSVTKFLPEPLPMWSHIEKVAADLAPNRFKAYSISFFQNNKIEVKPSGIDLFNFSIKKPISYEKQQLYEWMLKNNVVNHPVARSEEFKNYKLKTEINQSFQKLNDLDILLTLLNENECSYVFGLRIKTVFYYFAGMYYADLLKVSLPNLDSSDISRLMEAYCFDCKDKYLSFIFLTEIINKVHPYVNCIPTVLIDKFDTTICRSISNTWARGAYYIDKKYCFNIVNRLAPRRKIKCGEQMKILNSVFDKITDVVNYRCVNGESKSALYEFAVITGDHASMLKIYFLIEHVLFKYTIFDQFISHESSNNWLFFFNTINGFILHDKVLERELKNLVK